MSSLENTEDKEQAAQELLANYSMQVVETYEEILNKDVASTLARIANYDKNFKIVASFNASLDSVEKKINSDGVVISLEFETELNSLYGFEQAIEIAKRMIIEEGLKQAIAQFQESRG